MVVTHLSNRRYLVRLMVIRGGIVALFAALMGYLLATGSGLPHQGAIAAVLLGAVAGSLVLLHHYRRQAMSATVVVVQIWLDVILLTLLLYLSGGYTNPLISLYLLPVMVASMLLPRRQAWLLAAVVVALYALLMRYYIPLFGGSGSSHGFQQHLVGMGFSFVLSVVLIVSVVARIVEQQRQQALQLAALRQQSMRRRAVTAIGAQAAFDAHALGTPLNTMLILLEELQSGGDDVRARTIPLLLQQLQRCNRVLKTLTERGRALGGGDAERVSLSELVETTIAKWRNQHPATELALTRQGELSAVVVDPMMEQSLQVLLDNAVEAGATAIRVDLTREAGEVKLIVADNGTGFDEAVLPVAGQETVSSKPHGKGLGLYLVGFMMEQMAGMMRVRNREQGGAEVRLQVAGCGGGQPMKPLMLVVDDDPLFCEVFRKALTRREIASVTACSADEAITLIGEMRFTHAVVDLNLGSGDSGLAVLRALAATQPHCRAVMLTGFASIATAVEATKLGAVQYLPKPASVDAVLAAFSQDTQAEPPVSERPLSPSRLEWEYIQRVLLKNNGNVSATARELGMHRRTLQRKLAKYPPR